LVNLGHILKSAGLNDLDLNKETFESKRSFKNVQRYCALRELVLRYMDAKKVKGLRWFYRPIAASKSNHGKGK